MKNQFFQKKKNFPKIVTFTIFTFYLKATPLRPAPDPWTLGPLDPWPLGSLAPWTLGPLAPWILGPLDLSTLGPLAPWIVGPLEIPCQLIAVGCEPQAQTANLPHEPGGPQGAGRFLIQNKIGSNLHNSYMLFSDVLFSGACKY